jgi:hypothetical protein
MRKACFRNNSTMREKNQNIQQAQFLSGRGTWVDKEMEA